MKFNESEKKNETEMNNSNEIVYYMDLDFSDDNQATTEDCPMTQLDAELAPRRSERERQGPDYYGERVSIVNQKSEEPTSIEEAVTVLKNHSG